MPTWLSGNHASVWFTPVARARQMCYNPVTIEHIALYCIQDAPEGGESIITRNCDLPVPPKAKKFMADHNGILYSREVWRVRGRQGT